MKYPNRIAALTAAATAVAGAVVTLLGAVDTWQKTTVVCVGLFVVMVLATMYLAGSQKHEAHQARARAQHTRDNT